MKRFLSLLLLITTVLTANAWDMGVHVPSRNVSQANWDSAFASHEDIHFPVGDWTTAVKNIQPPYDNFSISGDGQNLTNLRFTSSSFVLSDFGFEFIGRSLVTIRDIRIVGGSSRHFAAVFKLKTFGANATTECRDITFSNVTFDSCYADCIQGGDKANNTETHHLINLRVVNCRATNIGNPTVKWLFADEPADSEKNHFINGRQTLWSAYVVGNYVKDICGDFFRSNLTGWQDATGFVPNPLIGNYHVTGNTATSCWFFCEWFGNLANGAYVVGNYWYNPTRNSGLANTFNCNKSTIKDNFIYTYCNRDAAEVRLTNSEYADNITIYQRAATEYPGTERTLKQSVMYAVLTTGANNKIHPTITCDRSGIKYVNSPDDLYGVLIAGFDDVANKPSLIDSLSYPHNLDFDGAKLYGFTGKAIYNEISGSPVAAIYIGSAFLYKTSYQNPSQPVFQPYNTTGTPGFQLDNPIIDLKGSATMNNTGGLINSLSALQGNIPPRTYITGLRLFSDNNNWSIGSQYRNAVKQYDFIPGRVRYEKTSQ